MTITTMKCACVRKCLNGTPLSVNIECKKALKRLGTGKTQLTVAESAVRALDLSPEISANKEKTIKLNTHTYTTTLVSHNNNLLCYMLSVYGGAVAGFINVESFFVQKIGS